ncbi:MAG TPA: aryl-sulfate sulfotransferase [Terracidiphilus sp.]|nr:aryl-sulfate sulfotransferase [Terracidiphilus sp.]
MQQKDQIRHCSILPSARRHRSRFAQSPASLARLSLALSLATICPLALFAGENQLGRGNGPRPPAPPVSASHADAATPGFALHTSATALQLLVGGSGKDLDIEAVPNDGFARPVTVKIDSLPQGIEVTPASLRLVPGTRQSFHITAVSNVAKGGWRIPLTAVSGSIQHGAFVVVQVTPTVTIATLNTLFFDFGNNLVGNKLIHTAVVVTNTGSSSLTMSPSLSGDASYSIVAKGSCGATLGAGKSCDILMRYLPTQASYPHAQDTALHLNFGNAAPGVPGVVAIHGVSAALQAGTVTPTNNPQVALYTMTMPFPGRMQVRFGEDKSYGFKTWFRSTQKNNGQIGIFVAGMKATTKYHMSAYVQLKNGVAAVDKDHTFTTGSLPAAFNFKLTATTTAGMTPSPGIEFTNPLTGLAAIDLQGNVIWTYLSPAIGNGSFLDGAKLLPNGNILLVAAPESTKPLGHPDLAEQTDIINEIREINLAGETVKELTIADLNASLATAPPSCVECQNLAVATFHHDVTPLPNGHWLLLTSTAKTLGPGTTPKLTNLPQRPVLGDVIIDVDQNMQPVWAWSEFNHLDPDRHPWSFPDWTHTNAVIYSPDDRNLIVSIRHQNWVLKIAYKDGVGDGHIIWSLGAGGTLKLVGGTDPTDWPYAQHGPGFFSPNTSGVFDLGLMDNGDDRLYPAKSSCQPQGALPASCLYSSIPVFRIDENAKTATLIFHQKIDSAHYNVWGGNTQHLPNGDVEYDLCGVIPSGSLVREVTMEKNPQTVWSLSIAYNYFYRAFRVPSLYPGVQW